MGGKLNSLSPTYTCTDNFAKTHRLIFDGGQQGQFILELCDRCYPKEDKQFLITEERINISSPASHIKIKSLEVHSI